MKAVYKVYREENEKPIIDLTVTSENEQYKVEELVSGVVIKETTSDGLNEVLHELNAPEDVRLEIKKAILNKQFGYLEEKQDKFESLLPRIKYDAHNIRTDFEIEYREFEDRIKKEIDQMDKKFDKFFDDLFK